LASKLHTVLAADVHHDEVNTARKRVSQRLTRAQLPKLQRPIGIAPTKARGGAIEYIEAGEQWKRTLPLTVRQRPSSLRLTGPSCDVDRALRKHHQRIDPRLFTGVGLCQHSPKRDRRLVDSA
jgi:hypothetical protein